MNIALKRLILKVEDSLNIWLYRFAISGRRKSQHHPPRKVLIAKLDVIGDFVLFSSTLSAYRALYREAHIVLLVQSSVFNLAETCPYVDEVWSIDTLRFRRNIFQHWIWYRKIVTASFDCAINAQHSTCFYYLECLVGWSSAPRRIAFECLNGEFVRDKTNPYYTELVPDAGSSVFEIDRNYAMLCHLGFDGKQCQPELWLTDDDLHIITRKYKFLQNEIYAVVFPGAFVARRRWPAQNYIEAIKELHARHHLYWLICGSKDEAELCSTISSALSADSIAHSVLAGTATLREISVLMYGARFYLGNETGGVHIAAAAGIPAVCILGGGHYGRFFPYPGNHLTIAVSHRMPCFNCNWECFYEEFECIRRVKVQDVVTEVDRLFKSSQRYC